jgi:hypothetical protein
VSPNHQPEGWGYAELEFWLSGGNMCPQTFSVSYRLSIVLALMWNTGVIGKHLAHNILQEVRIGIYQVAMCPQPEYWSNSIYTKSYLTTVQMDESNKQGFSPKYKDICTPMKNYYYSRAYNTWRFARDSGH